MQAHLTLTYCNLRLQIVRSLHNDSSLNLKGRRILTSDLIFPLLRRWRVTFPQPFHTRLSIPSIFPLFKAILTVFSYTWTNTMKFYNFSSVTSFRLSPWSFQETFYIAHFYLLMKVLIESSCWPTRTWRLWRCLFCVAGCLLVDWIGRQALHTPLTTTISPSTTERQGKSCSLQTKTEGVATSGWWAMARPVFFGLGF